MGHFGSRVIGPEKAAEEAAVQKSGADHFGPRVIGDVLAARRLLERQDDGAKDSRSDPAKRAAKQAARQAGGETIEAPVTANLEELELALELNPAFYDPLYRAEFARPVPRKGALRLFLRHEMDHLDREERKADIVAALK